MQPVMDTQKRTTKVNLAVIIGVVFFFAVMGWLVVHYFQHPEKPRDEQNRRLNSG